MIVHEVEHALVDDALTQLRDVATDRPTFRRLLRLLSTCVIYEALRDTPSQPVQVETPLALTQGRRLSSAPVIVPVLRAGLGMLDAALDLSPSSLVGFVGAKRNEETFVAETYLDSLPDDLSGSSALIIDPMLATGGSLADTVERVTSRQPAKVIVATIIAAPEGVDRLREHGQTDLLVTAAIDDHLTEAAYISPGLGDAGDRQFGNF